MTHDSLSLSLVVLKQFNIIPEFYQVGYTKLYFRAGQIGALEETRKRILLSVIGFQKYYRGYKARCQFMKLKSRVSVLQSFIHGEDTRRKYASLLTNQRAVLQNPENKHKHCRNASKVLEEQLKAIIRVQSVVRGWLARKHFDDLQTSEDSNVKDDRINQLPNKGSQMKRIFRSPMMLWKSLKDGLREPKQIWFRRKRRMQN